MLGELLVKFSSWFKRSTRNSYPCPSYASKSHQHVRFGTVNSHQGTFRNQGALEDQPNEEDRGQKNGNAQVIDDCIEALNYPKPPYQRTSPWEIIHFPNCSSSFHLGFRLSSTCKHLDECVKPSESPQPAQARPHAYKLNRT